MASRKNVPLRETLRIQVDDGTMCRMPSPIAGPLREEIDVDPASPISLHRGLSSSRISTAPTSPVPVTLARGEAA